jgi:hypothetical protein
MHETEWDRMFDEWLARHKGILFKVVHAYAFEHADRQDLFQEINRIKSAPAGKRAEAKSWTSTLLKELEAE